MSIWNSIGGWVRKSTRADKTASKAKAKPENLKETTQAQPQSTTQTTPTSNPQPNQGKKFSFMNDFLIPAEYGYFAGDLGYDMLSRSLWDRDSSDILMQMGAGAGIGSVVGGINSLRGRKIPLNWRNVTPHLMFGSTMVKNAGEGYYDLRNKEVNQVSEQIPVQTLMLKWDGTQW